jgi:hypothetical protein
VRLSTVVIDRLRVRIDKNTRVALLLCFDFWRGEVEHQFGVCGHAKTVEHVFGNRYHVHEQAVIAGFGDETQRTSSCML